MPQSEFDRTPRAAQAIRDSEANTPTPGPFRIQRLPEWHPVTWIRTRSPDRLRDRASQAVGALADLLEAVAAVEADEREIRGQVADELAELAASAYQAVGGAHREFVAMPHRPSGVDGRTAALGRLIDDLNWFDPIAREQPAHLI